MRKNTVKAFIFHLALSFLVLTLLSAYFPQLGIEIRGVGANPSVSQKWFYSGWQYRKEHNITFTRVNDRFYDTSNRWTTISGNPTQRHAFQPIHNTTIVEVNKIVDGATRKYLAYDSDTDGSEIRLYYTNDLNGVWTAYSGNPILGPDPYHFRWPSVAYVKGIFQMFLTDRSDLNLERWTSTDGIYFTFKENVKTGGNLWKNPFICYSPKDAKWFLYSHDSSGGAEYIKVRNATNIEDLDLSTDKVVISRTGTLGSPTVMYYESTYWLLVEIFEGSTWKVEAYYSTVSPSSGFIECSNSPILSADEACPMLFLSPDETRAYLFTNRDSSNWYQDTREVYINRSILSPNIINYQVRITAYYGSGTDGGENVYLNGHSRTDFGDVRFAWYNSSSGSEVKCDYWIEELKESQSAVFWVKIPEISSKLNNTIYIYYGKSDTTTTSSGNDTFDFFDDFSGTLSKWTVVSGTWQIESGELSAQTNAVGQRIRANNFVFGNHSVHVKIKWISGTYFEHGPYVRGQSPNEQNNGYMTYLSTWAYDSRHRISKMSSAIETTITGQGTTNPSKNVWYNCVFKLYGNTLKSSISPLYSTEISGTDSTFRSGTLSLYSWGAPSEHVHYDNLFVRKYVSPEPSHGRWGSEEIGTYVIIDRAYASDERSNVGSAQTIGFHARWNNNGSNVVGGSIYVNDTGYVTNSTGWISFQVSASVVGKEEWIVTGVNCGGVTMYTQTAQTPSIVWDRITIIDGGVSKESLMLGEKATVWFKALYEYDNDVFDGTNGVLYVNDSAMSWSTTNNRWEYNYVATTPGSKAFIISGATDNSYSLTVINDTIGAQTINVWSSAFSVISNSTVSELAFNSTSRILSFIVSGPSGTIGSTNVTISKTLIEDINELKVYLDGNQINYTAISTDYHWLIHFTYQHSTHKVVIILDSPHAESFVETPLGTATTFSGIVIAILAAILLVLITTRKKLARAKRNSRWLTTSHD